ncbi:MAG: PepSY domain-containing protein [Alphaproteobacteria bacterium]|nr:PepSY domain-containing protein [Alphaproteobacteria bacterium]
MISPRLARRIASIHKWLGLIVGLQLLVWTGTGLFFTVFAIADIRGDHLVRETDDGRLDLARVKLSVADALAAVVEDRPAEVVLRPMGGQPVYEIRADIGVFVVSAETGTVLSLVPEDIARRIAEARWAGEGRLEAMLFFDIAPPESGLTGPSWAAHFAGRGNPVIYVNAANGRVGPVRTDLWRTYDFLWSLHIMDYRTRENFNHPLIIAAAVLALTTVLFGVALVVQRFTRPKIGSG